MQNDPVEVTEADREYAKKCRWVETTVDDLDYLAGLFAEVRIAAEQAAEKRGAEGERARIIAHFSHDPIDAFYADAIARGEHLGG